MSEYVWKRHGDVVGGRWADGGDDGERERATRQSSLVQERDSELIFFSLSPSIAALYPPTIHTHFTYEYL